MNFTEMSIDELLERRAAIAGEIEADGADLDALEAEVRGINSELENRKNEEAKKAELRAAVAAGQGEVIKKLEPAERNIPTMEEIRSTHEYNVAYANYIKTGNDAECRALLTENVSGTVPVASYVEGRVRTAWERDGITSRVRKTFLKGNVKIGYEISASGAVVHTEAANSAVTEEQLVLGIVSLVPQSIKKWISISDEVYDLAGEEFLDYIYDELTYRIAKKLADAIIADIEACGTASTGALPAVPKITSTTVTLGLIAQAMAELSDEAADPVIMMNKSTWGEFKKAQADGNFGYDPFEGLPVVFNDTIPAFSAATTGVTYAIVGDLGVGAQANFPNGQEIEIKFDDKTKMEYDLVRILGREFVGHAVVAPKAFVKIVH
ncbi:MAG: phage major capsid protein [Clostridia bacterium]|nr:phage major capsid protein [Clostridia bacterium]